MSMVRIATMTTTMPMTIMSMAPIAIMPRSQCAIR